MRRRRRAQLTSEVGAQPAHGEREARPGRRAQHVRQHAQVEREGGLAAHARAHVRQAARGVRVLPGPLELRAGSRGFRAAPGLGPKPPPLLPPPSPPPRLLSYPKGGHGGREAVHDKHHLPGDENEDVAHETPTQPVGVKPNPFAMVRPQSYPRVEFSRPASGPFREAPPPLWRYVPSHLSTSGPASSTGT